MSLVFRDCRCSLYRSDDSFYPAYIRPTRDHGTKPTIQCQFSLLVARYLILVRGKETIKKALAIASLLATHERAVRSADQSFRVFWCSDRFTDSNHLLNSHASAGTTCFSCTILLTVLQEK